jgi:hypothetical protein
MQGHGLAGLQSDWQLYMMYIVAHAANHYFCTTQHISRCRVFNSLCGHNTQKNLAFMSARMHMQSGYPTTGNENTVHQLVWQTMASRLAFMEQNMIPVYSFLTAAALLHGCSMHTTAS